MTREEGAALLAEWARGQADKLSTGTDLDAAHRDALDAGLLVGGEE